MAKKRKGSDADPATMFAVLVIFIVVISLGVFVIAWVLYVPLKKHSNDNPGKRLGVFGIAVVVLGTLVLAYQVFSRSAESATLLSETSWKGWLPLFSGLAIYLVGLAIAQNHRVRVLTTQREIQALVADENLTDSQLLETAQKLCEDNALPASEAQGALAYASRIRSLRTIEGGGILPVTSPPPGVFLKPQEQCHASFRGAVLFEDVFGSQRSTGGAAVYWKVADGITLRPSAYSSKSMPVAELKKVDSGSLAITSSRVIFQGQRYRLDFPISKIEGLSQYNEGFQIQTSGKAKRQVFSMHPVEVRLATVIISKLAAATRA